MRHFIIACLVWLGLATAVSAEPAHMLLGAGGSNGATSNDGFFTANNWRVRNTVGNDASFWGAVEIGFLTTAGDSYQGTCNTPASSATVSGTVAASAFDNNTGTELIVNYVPSTAYMECDFTSARKVKEFIYNPRASFPAQSPRAGIVEYWDGAAWQEAGEFHAQTGWVGGTARRFAMGVPMPGSDSTGHRFWRINVTAVWGSTLWALEELEFKRSGTIISTAYDATVSTGGFTTPQNLFDGTEANGAIGNSASLPAYAGVDFGYKRTVDQVDFWVRTNGSFVSQTPKIGTVDYSDDGSSWTTCWSFSDPGSTPSAGAHLFYTGSC